jgi:hypothetical protein
VSLRAHLWSVLSPDLSALNGLFQGNAGNSCEGYRIRNRRCNRQLVLGVLCVLYLYTGNDLQRSDIR